MATPSASYNLAQYSTPHGASSRGRPAFLALSLQWKLAALVVIVVLFSGLVAGYFMSQSLTRQIDELVGARLLGLARLTANRPEVVAAFKSDHPEEILQPLVEKWVQDGDLDLIVIFNMQGIRYAHPNKELVGLHFTGGDEGPALQGEEYVSHATGISGPSLRAFVPVRDEQGRQVGVVVAGVFMSSLTAEVNRALVDVGTLSSLGLVVALLGALAVAYNIKSSIFGLEPPQIAAILEERVAILQSIREGVVAVDREGRVTMINGEAGRLIGVGQEAVGRAVTELMPNSRLPIVVASGQPESDQEQVINGTVILTNRVPIMVNGEVVGAVATFRDMSEIRELAAELTGERQMADTLRAQAHEFVNRLHTVLGLLQLGKQKDAVQYISTFSRMHDETVGLVTRGIKQTQLAGLLLGKISAAHERGISLSLDPDCHVPVHDEQLRQVDLVTVVGNLIENAFDAVASLPEDRRNVWVSLYSDERETLVEVEDTGVGIRAADRARIFDRGFTTKEGNKGIGLFLVHSQVSGAGGSIEVDGEEGAGTRFTVHLPRTDMKYSGGRNQAGA